MFLLWFVKWFDIYEWSMVLYEFFWGYFLVELVYVWVFVFFVGFVVVFDLRLFGIVFKYVLVL